MNFRDLYDRFNTGNTAGTANAIADDLQLSLRAREYLGALILNECERIERDRVRNVEASSWTKRTRKASSSATPRQGVLSTSLSERDRLLTKTFALGDGRRVPWGSATIDDHKARIDLLRRYRVGLDRTITRHVEAIEEITEAGVSCLNEIKAVTA